MKKVEIVNEKIYIYFYKNFENIYKNVKKNNYKILVILKSKNKTFAYIKDIFQ